MLLDKLTQEFKRLKISVDQDPYSGLSAEMITPLIVKIYDDHASGFYRAETALSVLASLLPTDGDILDLVWGSLADCEVSDPEDQAG